MTCGLGYWNSWNGQVTNCNLGLGCGLGWGYGGLYGAGCGYGLGGCGYGLGGCGGCGVVGCLGACGFVGPNGVNYGCTYPYYSCSLPCWNVCYPFWGCTCPIQPGYGNVYFPSINCGYQPVYNDFCASVYTPKRCKVLTSCN